VVGKKVIVIIIGLCSYTTMVDFIVNLFIPESIGEHTGQHYSHIYRPRWMGHGMNPADSAAGLNQWFALKKPGIKVNVLTNLETVCAVNPDAESFKTNIASLSLEGVDITFNTQALTGYRKFEMNTFIAPSFRKVEAQLRLLFICRSLCSLYLPYMGVAILKHHIKGLMKNRDVKYT
jgi:hypothetical protein